MQYANISFAAWYGSVCDVVATIGIFYTLLAAVLMRRVTRWPVYRPSRFPGITILKPLHGPEPALYDNLASFCEQTYCGPVQIIFGIDDYADPAIDALQGILANYPGRDFSFVVDSRRHGSNPKVSNLLNMIKLAHHEILVLADSDIRVNPDYLNCVVGSLEQPGVGLVTSLFRGGPASTVLTSLASMAIDYHFMPAVVVGMAVGMARPCFGATMALRRETLQGIGGLEIVVDVLADDFALGEAVRKAGDAVAVLPFAVSHGCSASGIWELLRQEIRWARTIRSLNPVGFVASAVTYPLPVAILSCCLGNSQNWNFLLVMAAILSRLALQRRVNAVLGASDARLPLGPLRDLLSFVVFAASLFASSVEWRGVSYRVHFDGTLSAS